MSDKSRVGLSVAFGYLLGRLLYPSEQTFTERLGYGLFAAVVIVVATFAVTWLIDKQPVETKDKEKDKDKE